MKVIFTRNAECFFWFVLSSKCAHDWFMPMLIFQNTIWLFLIKKKFLCFKVTKFWRPYRFLWLNWSFLFKTKQSRTHVGFLFFLKNENIFEHNMVGSHALIKIKSFYINHTVWKNWFVTSFENLVYDYTFFIRNFAILDLKRTV